MITNGAGSVTTAAATVVVTGVVWANSAYAGTELGTQAQPFNTLGEAAASVVSGGTIKMIGGTTSSETVRITKPLRLEAVGGPVRIGGSA